MKNESINAIIVSYESLSLNRKLLLPTQRSTQRPVFRGYNCAKAFMKVKLLLNSYELEIKTFGLGFRTGGVYSMIDACLICTLISDLKGAL